jgi:urease accessory protein UreF
VCRQQVPRGERVRDARLARPPSGQQQVQAVVARVEAECAFDSRTVSAIAGNDDRGHAAAGVERKQCKHHEQSRR